jgi:hypothetical protein
LPATLRLTPPRSQAGDEEPSGRAYPSRLGIALDFTSDLGVLAFATWTFIAWAGMATQARVSLLVPIWLATVPFLAVGLAILNRRRNDGPPPKRVAEAEETEAATPLARRLVVGTLAGVFVSAILAGAAEGAPWPFIWIGAFVAVVVAVALGRLGSREEERPSRLPGWSAHAFAALTGLGFATMSLFINRPNGDDTFYVSRAVGTAQLNRIPVRDIVFTEEQVGPISGAGLPVDSFSALVGAGARFVGIHGASAAYYVSPPLMTFLATWALWRVIRSWAPRNVVLCFALGAVYWIFSAQSALTPGSYFLNRMWQGKVIFVAWMVMTAYVLMTRWLRQRDAATAVLLLAAGVGSIGMTASAAFVAPLLFSVGMLPLLVRRDWRGLPILLGAAAIPLLAGFIATRLYPVELLVIKPLSNSYYFHEIFGWGLVAAVGLIGLCTAPWLARSGAAAALTASCALVAVLIMAPRLLPTLNDVTDLTSVLRRTLWVVPLPALVGLLGAFPVVQLFRRLAGRPVWIRRLAAAAPALLVAGLLVQFGHPVWISWRTGNPMWEAPPVWKIHDRQLENARAILKRYHGSDAILVEEPIMHALALITVDPKVVNARGFYARLTPETRQRTRFRLSLTRFVEGEEPTPPDDLVRRALADLDVGLVCVNETKTSIIEDVESIGYREAFRARKLVCLRRTGSLVAAVGRESTSAPVFLRGTSAPGS